VIIAVAYAVPRRARGNPRPGWRALAGTHVPIDLSDSLSFDLKAVLYGALLDG
jgi:hypothetical protein